MKRFYFFILIVYTVAVSRFLPQAVLIDIQDTSHGTLGEGIEHLGTGLEDLASDLDGALDSLDSQIDASISVTVQASVALLDVQIDDLENELKKLYDKINIIELELASVQQFCEPALTCAQCLVHAECVWCAAEQSCLAGDEDGPLNNECVSYDYDTCTDAPCSDYSTCEVCLADNNCG